MAKRKKFTIGNLIVHSVWSSDDLWTITKPRPNNHYEVHHVWFHFGSITRDELKAYMLIIWKWQLIFGKARKGKSNG